MNRLFRLLGLILVCWLLSGMAEAREGTAPGRAAIETPGDPEIFVPPLEKGRNYPFLAGNNGFGGMASLSFDGKKCRVKLPVFVFGASLFGMATHQEVLSVNKHDHEMILPEYFLPGAASFDDIPALKKKVLEIFRKVEQVYSHPRFELKILPTFVKDELHYHRPKLSEDYRGNKNFPQSYFKQQTFVPALSANRTINPRKFAVVFTPFQVGDLMSPIGWDIYSKNISYLIAHEFGHILGIPSEGFLKQDYPLDALMTDGTAIRVLWESTGKEVPTRLYPADINSLLLGILGSIKEGYKLPPDLARELFAKGIDGTYPKVILGRGGKSYYSMSSAARRAYKSSLLPKR